MVTPRNYSEKRTRRESKREQNRHTGVTDDGGHLFVSASLARLWRKIVWIRHRGLEPGDRRASLIRRSKWTASHYFRPDVTQTYSARDEGDKMAVPA